MMDGTQQTHKILAGQWGEGVRWEFHLGSNLPTDHPCTAVFCLALLNTRPPQIVLTRGPRGWELLGGHLEPGESLEAALRREAVEEGGFHAADLQLFGYRKVVSTSPVLNDHHGGTYPPVAYIPHFITTTARPLTAPSGAETLEARAFSLTALPAMETSNRAIIDAGLATWHRAVAEAV